MDTDFFRNFSDDWSVPIDENRRRYSPSTRAVSSRATQAPVSVPTVVVANDAPTHMTRDQMIAKVQRFRAAREAAAAAAERAYNMKLALTFAVGISIPLVLGLFVSEASRGSRRHFLEATDNHPGGSQHPWETVEEFRERMQDLSNDSASSLRIRVSDDNSEFSKPQSPPNDVVDIAASGHRFLSIAMLIPNVIRRFSLGTAFQTGSEAEPIS